MSGEAALRRASLACSGREPVWARIGLKSAGRRESIRHEQSLAEIPHAWMRWADHEPAPPGWVRWTKGRIRYVGQDVLQVSR